MEFDFSVAVVTRFIEKSMKLAELNALLKCCKRKIWRNNESKNLKFLGCSKILVIFFSKPRQNRSVHILGTLQIWK